MKEVFQKWRVKVFLPRSEPLHKKIPKLAKLESSLMLILFLFIEEGSLGGLMLVDWEFLLLLILKEYVFVKKKINWELSGRLSENSSKISNRIPTIMLVHLKFCCPWNDCQHPENPNWTYNYIYNQITILFSWYASRAWLLKLYQIKA